MADQPSRPDRIVVLGRVAAPFGVHGWVKLQPFTAEPAGMQGYACFWAGERENYAVEEIAVHGRSVVCKLKGLDTREQAALLVGKELGVPRSQMPQGGPDEIYWTDLIGMQVMNVAGVAFGKIAQMIDNGPQSVMLVQGERERLIPFVPAFVREVSMEQRRVIVDWGEEF